MELKSRSKQPEGSCYYFTSQTIPLQSKTQCTTTIIRLMALIRIAIKAPIFVSGILSHIIWCHSDCHRGTSIKSVIDRWQGPIKEQPRVFVSFLPLAINVLSLVSECSTPTSFFFKSQLKWALPHGNFLSFPWLQVFSLPSMLPVKLW